jgi:hypothetical protein
MQMMSNADLIRYVSDNGLRTEMAASAISGLYSAL